MELLGFIPSDMKYYPLIAIITTILFTIIRTVIDTINITNFEKKLLSPRKRFYIDFSKFGLYSLVFTLVTFLLSLKEIPPDIEERGPTNLELLFIAILMFLIILTCVFVVYYFLSFIIYLLGINYDYYLITPEMKWLIIRVNNAGRIVASNKSNMAFFEDNISNRYEVKVSISKLKKKIYQDLNRKVFNRVFFSVTWVCLFFIIWLLNYSSFENLTKLIMFIISFLILFISFIFWLTKLEFETYLKRHKPKKYKLKKQSI